MTIRADSLTREWLTDSNIVARFYQHLARHEPFWDHHNLADLEDTVLVDAETGFPGRKRFGGRPIVCLVHIEVSAGVVPQRQQHLFKLFYICAFVAFSEVGFKRIDPNHCGNGCVCCLEDDIARRHQRSGRNGAKHHSINRADDDAVGGDSHNPGNDAIGPKAHTPFGAHSLDLHGPEPTR